MRQYDSIEKGEEQRLLPSSYAVVHHKDDRHWFGERRTEGAPYQEGVSCGAEDDPDTGCSNAGIFHRENGLMPKPAFPVLKSRDRDPPSDVSRHR
jgi:hypothetical protein